MASPEEATRLRLEAAVGHLGQLGPRQLEAGLPAFHALRNGVSRASGGGQVVRDLLAGLEPKVAVLAFLLELHKNRRIYRRQVAGVLLVLLQVDEWLLALKSDKELWLNLPPDLIASLPVEPRKVAVQPQRLEQRRSQTTDPARGPEELRGIQTPHTNPKILGGQPGCVTGRPDMQGDRSPALQSESQSFAGDPLVLDGEAEEPACEPETNVSEPGSSFVGELEGEVGGAEAWTIEPELHDGKPRIPLGKTNGQPLVPARVPSPRTHSPRTLQIREAVAAAKASAAGDRARYQRTSTVRETIELLNESKRSLEAVSFSSAGSMDEVLAAFETFRKAVVQAVQSKSKADHHVLEDFDPKEETLEFLVGLYELRRKYRSRVADVLVRLLTLESWRAAAVADASVIAVIQDCDSYYTDDVAQAVPSACTLGALKKAASAAVARGGVGALCVQVIAAHNLMPAGQGGNGEIYVRIMLGHVLKRTHTVSSCTSPNWNSSPFFFDVTASDTTLEFEVLDGTIRVLGTLSVECPSFSTQEEPPSARYKLVGAPQAELELRLAFIPGELPRTPSPARDERPVVQPDFALAATLCASPCASLESTVERGTETCAPPGSRAEDRSRAPNEFTLHWAVSLTTSMTVGVVAVAVVAILLWPFFCPYARRRR